MREPMSIRMDRDTYEFPRTSTLLTSGSESAHHSPSVGSLERGVVSRELKEEDHVLVLRSMNFANCSLQNPPLVLAACRHLGPPIHTETEVKKCSTAGPQSGLRR